MSVYARALKRRDRLTGNTLTEYSRALQWAEMGRIEPEAGAAATDAVDTATLETASQSRNLQLGPDSSAG
jgi:hypothetical protein